MTKSHKNAGNFNLRGKKEVMLKCRCCDCVDFREKELLKEHKKKCEMERWTAQSKVQLLANL